MNRSDIIREVGLERWVLPDRSYPAPLPDDLLPYYCYTRDGGHSLLVVVENEYRQGLSPVRFIIPAPVKMVLKAGYRLQDGLLWATLPYDRDEGLRVDDTDVEY
ncbi:MAG: hypothetical protein LUQ37_00810 [Methanoregulaceae archaeon]|jgi:hypothetical protein|nr:hypothetical protein [Methanoregulaceae archaeon]